MEMKHINNVEDTIIQVQTIARNYFRQDLNCSECVF